MGVAKDMMGMQFGRLTVIGRAPSRKGLAYWVCQCNCENKTIKEVSGSCLRQGKVASCGCLHDERNRQSRGTNGNRLPAGKKFKDTKLYNVYSKMIQRCENKNDPGYKWYGARGISLCSEWRKSFPKFYNWAMANGYSEGLTIDRIDVNGNYEPENCRWVTMKIQNNNKTDNRIITIDGVSKTLSEWCDFTGMNYNTVMYRLRNGWSDKDALMSPLIRKRKLRNT